MTAEKASRCAVCGERMETRRENYKYDASGLDNVTLAGIEVRHCPQCGNRVALIPAIDRLHKAIANALIDKPGRLLPKEIRFLRKCLGLSSQDMAEKIGVDRSTWSKYESVGDPQPMGKQTERLLRLFVKYENPVQNYPVEKWATEEPKSERLTLVSRKDGWHADSNAA